METNKTVSFLSLGCRVNQYEIQSLREQFTRAGFCEVPFGEKCDLCIINTCAVTKESEKKSRNAFSRAKKCADKVFLTGCYAELCRKNGVLPQGAFYVGGCSGRDGILSVCLGEEKEYKEKTAYEPLSIGTTGELPNERYRSYVKIEDGCNGRCSYCVIPKLRGKPFNRPEADILEEIRRLTASGVSEIILTGIEVSDYGSRALCRLIEKAALIEGVRRIRTGSLNPNTVTPAFIETIKNTDPFCKHLHLSVQSGSDEVLKAMRRPYGAKKLYQVIDSIYAALPQILITADIISGFPGETDAQFEETLGFIKYARFSHVHAFPYSPRPFTEAACMPCQVEESVKRERNARVIAAAEENKACIARGLLGTDQTVLVEKYASRRSYGHTEGFLEASLGTRRNAGEYVRCRVTGYDGKLICEAVND